MIPTWLVATGTFVLVTLLLLSQIARFRDDKQALTAIRDSAPPITREERAEWMHLIHVEIRALILLFGMFGVLADAAGAGVLVIQVLQNPPPNTLLYWGELSAAAILPTVYIFGWFGFFIWSRYYIKRERVMRRRLRD